MGFFKSSKKEKKEKKDGNSVEYSSSAETISSALKEVKNVPAPFPEDEENRLKKLLEYNVLDTAASRSFDELTELASSICKTPIALVSLIDKDRQWFKSRVGLEAQETSRDAAFCTYTILNKNQVMVVPDALEDERFAQNELVLGGPKIRFYAGAALVSPDGYALGTLCAIDTVPRDFDEKQQRALQIISHQVVAQLEIEKHVTDLKGAIQELQVTQDNLKKEKEFAENASISSFENLLLSASGLAAFQDFLSQEFCSENLSFWKDAKEFALKFPKRNSEENLEEALKMIEWYIRDGSPKQVNISSTARTDIFSLADQKNISATLFEEARKEVFSLMKRDSYNRFLSSQQYKDLMQTVRHVGVMRLQAAGD